jgi:uncharacterized tellurite resistance protein B-like protein
MLGFIIFGTRGVRSTVEQGQFYCPQCDGQKPYKLKKVTQFFTLYFIPLIPLGSKGKYVECQNCKNTYIERILEMKPTIDVSERPQPKPQVESRPRIESNPQTETVEQIPSYDTSADDEKPRQRQEEELMPAKQRAIKKLLIMMILADGVVDDQEISVFHKVYKDTTGAYVGNIYHEIDVVKGKREKPEEYLKSVATFLNEEGKRDVIKACMMIAAADGDIDPSELKMVKKFGEALEMRPAEVKAIIDQVIIPA